MKQNVAHGIGACAGVWVCVDVTENGRRTHTHVGWPKTHTQTHTETLR